MTQRIYASEARTTDPDPVNINMADFSRMHLVIDVTNVTSTGSVTFTVEAFDSVSGSWYLLLVSAALTAAGLVVLRIGPEVVAAANLIAQDYIPDLIRVSATHLNSVSLTYSVGLNKVK